MTKRERVEMFILLKDKMDELVDIVNDFGARNDFMATYCFGLTVGDEEESNYEFMAGYQAEGEEEIDIMTTAIYNCYDELNGRPNEDTSGIDYWLNLN
jgi:hypothetical protein|tara:strand:- start:5945 stop:6238 length:294 start_codon:yes stop_codon:yes gene_type:complete